MKKWILLIIPLIILWAYYLGIDTIRDCMTRNEPPASISYWLYKYIKYNEVGFIETFLIGLFYWMAGILVLAVIVLICLKIQLDYEKK